MKRKVRATTSAGDYAALYDVASWVEDDDGRVVLAMERRGDILHDTATLQFSPEDWDALTKRIRHKRHKQRKQRRP